MDTTQALAILAGDIEATDSERELALLVAGEFLGGLE